MYRNNYITRPPKMYSSTTDKVNKLDNKIMDKVGLQRAYDTKSGLYQHGNNSYIAGSRDFRDCVDDLNYCLIRELKIVRDMKKLKSI